MKRILPLLILLLFGVGIAPVSATHPIDIRHLNPAGDERAVKDFNGIVAGGPVRVVVKFGDKESLRFEGDADAISTLVSEVKGELLIIRPKTSWVSWARKYAGKQITAYVTAKQITSLSMSGDGSISVTGTVVATEFTATLSGSGSIKANVEADKITGVVSGSGSSDISGKADVASVTLSGPGNFGSKQLAVNKELSARISGAGSIKASTDGKINAVISGSGHVYFAGAPEIEQRVIGAGGVAELK
jgi:hypothetical protein